MGQKITIQIAKGTGEIVTMEIDVDFIKGFNEFEGKHNYCEVLLLKDNKQIAIPINESRETFMKRIN